MTSNLERLLLMSGISIYDKRKGQRYAEHIIEKSDADQVKGRVSGCSGRDGT